MWRLFLHQESIVCQTRRSVSTISSLTTAAFSSAAKAAPVRLEGLPLQLLMFLVDRRGQLVTREDISSTLWSKDVFVDVEQGINTAIRKIRRALADDADEPQYLQTVVGRGYRFVAPSAVEDAGQSPGGFSVSAEELGRAIMTAAGLDPENPREIRKPPGGRLRVCGCSLKRDLLAQSVSHRHSFYN